MTRFYSAGDRGAGFFGFEHGAAGRVLFYSGCAITLLYFPSGLMHLLLGNGVYFRDVLLVLHLVASVLWLGRIGKAAMFVRRSWPLVVPAMFMLPALGMHGFAVEALTLIKWAAFWLDWAILGQLGYRLLVGFESPVKIVLGIAALLLLVDAVAGLYETRTGTYLIHESGQTSAFGVPVRKELNLNGRIRADGLQRDVFSFSNLMGMSVVASLLVFVINESLGVRLASIGWGVLFSTALFQSGGRSAFFGVLGAALVTVSLLAMPELTRRRYNLIVLIWLAIGLLISFTGVGQLAEFGGSTMQGSHIGDSESAYMRDANWAGIMEAIKTVPIVLFTGAPIASLIEMRIDPIYHWADNQYLWLFYHTSIFGFFALCIYFTNILRLPVGQKSTWPRDGVVLFLLYVMGEAIARESMTFLGCMPLFVMCGWQSAVVDEEHSGAARTPSRRARKSANVRSEAADFAKRIRDTERNRGQE